MVESDWKFCQTFNLGSRDRDIDNPFILEQNTETGDYRQRLLVDVVANSEWEISDLLPFDDPSEIDDEHTVDEIEDDIEDHLKSFQ